jgi:outer membrane protein TolC
LHPKQRPATHRRRSRALIAALIAATGLSPGGGCGSLRKLPRGPHATTASYHDSYGLQIEYPEVEQCATPVTTAAEQAVQPFALEDPANVPKLELSLEEAIQMAVQQSPVLRTIGGTVVSLPQGTATVYDPGLAAASPILGTEAALAEFDAQYTQQLFWSYRDQPQNLFVPPSVGGSPGFNEFIQSANFGRLANFNGTLSKTTATGARFALRHVVDYDRTNQGGGIRRFDSAFAGWLEAEWRQPLLQGAGTTFNRIAGPNSVPGQYNGVLIARVNEDVALADFESAVIQLVSDVELAYWDLVAAYRILDTQVRGRAAALQTFQYQQVRLEVGSGRSDEEAQARSQYYQFQAQVEVALGGPNGLYSAEQRLRYLIGLAASDGRLICPTTELNDVKVVFDWDSALSQALERRVEVRRQRMEVKRREMELIAARLNMRPRLDLLAQYRWVGLGDHLVGSSTQSLDSLYGTISGGKFQEGQAGIELDFPVGFRAAGVAIAHARLGLRREQAVLAETELRISHDLSDAARNIELTHQLVETNYNRVAADLLQVDVLNRRYLDGSDNINFLLQAQRQAVISLSEFYRSLANYNLAIREVHRQKGSLLAFNQVQLAEGAWAPGAAQDAYEVGRFLHPRRNPEDTWAPMPLTSGPFDPAAIQSTVQRDGDATGPALAPEAVLDGSTQQDVPPQDAPPQVPPPPEVPQAMDTLRRQPLISPPLQGDLRDGGLLESAVN